MNCGDIAEREYMEFGDRIICIKRIDVNGRIHEELREIDKRYRELKGFNLSTEDICKVLQGEFNVVNWGWREI